VSIFFQGAAGTAPRIGITGPVTTLQGVAGATLAAWATFSGAPTANEEAICNISNGLLITQTRANISFRHQSNVYRASARRLDADAVVIVDSVSPISAAPTFVCGVFEYTNQIARIYINAVQEATIAVPGWTGLTSVTPGLGAAIGGRADGNPPSSPTGLISDVMVFSRALSATEIAGLFRCQGRGNNYFGRGNLFRLQGVALNAIVAASGNTSDSVGVAIGTPLGGPPQLLGANYIAVHRRRRRR
jgi:hypothetical protein